jgi:hypothetical protein
MHRIETIGLLPVHDPRVNAKHRRQGRLETDRRLASGEHSVVDRPFIGRHMRHEDLAALVHSPLPVSFERLLLVVTGSVNAVLVPYWLNWLRQMYPQLTTHLMVTRSAEQFIRGRALQALVTGTVRRDVWDDSEFPVGGHLEIDNSTDCYGVFPTTLDFAMRLAAGRSSTPADGAH